MGSGHLQALDVSWGLEPEVAKIQQSSRVQSFSASLRRTVHVNERRGGYTAPYPRQWHEEKKSASRQVQPGRKGKPTRSAEMLRNHCQFLKPRIRHPGAKELMQDLPQK